MTIQEITTRKEDQTFDCKSIQIDPKALAVPIVAFANADGGVIAIGVSDKTRKIEGVDQHTETLVQHIGKLRLLVNPNYARIKEANELSKNGQNDRAWEIFREIAASGGVPEEAHEGYGWVIYRYLRDHLETLTSRQVREQLRDYINLKNARPSLLHSQILSFALKYSKQDEEFKLVSFLRWWEPDNLRSEDFQDSAADDGKTIPSLMSRIASAVVNYPVDDIQAFVDLLPFRKDDFRNIDPLLFTVRRIGGRRWDSICRC